MTESRKMLVERIAASRYLNRSARLKDLLFYLTNGSADIHEQEVGHQVFGRPVDYDTGSDNIVRVHASMLRKRLEQYFSAEGADEPLILEIPKGNYAPVFREREAVESAAPIEPVPPPSIHRPVWPWAAVALLFACSTAYLLIRRNVRTEKPTPPFWGQMFQPGRATDLVLDDAAVANYEDLTSHPLTLSNYFDRTYLRTVPAAAESMVIHRQSSFAAASVMWKLMKMPGSAERLTTLRFARDYSFRELKANNAVLLGNRLSNPWLEAFEPLLGIRWKAEKTSGSFYPVDTWSANREYRSAGYCALAFLPNLGHTGNVLTLAGTGGSAMNACADFLADEQAVSSLRRTLPEGKPDVFPYFETLLRVNGRSTLPRDASIVLSRPPRR